MPIRTKVKKPDAYIKRIMACLGTYESEHPHALIDIYRRYPGSVRIRIIDPDFKGMNLVERDDALRKILDDLSDDDLQEIGLLLLFTPKEANASYASKEFDDPVPSLE